MTADEEMYRCIVQAVPEGIWIVDARGQTIFCTERMAEILGTDVETMAVRSCFEVVFPADLPEAEHQFALGMTGKHPPFDFRLRRIDGSEIWVSISCRPMRDVSGAVVGLLGLFTDISERRRTAEHFRLAVESAPGAMVLVNHEHKIVMVNAQAEKLFGYERQELLGQSVDVLVPESSRKNHPAIRKAFFAQPQARTLGAGRDLRGQRKDGTLVPVEIGLNPIKTKEGIWVLTSILDITERKRAEEALRESEARFRNMADTAPVMIWVSGPDKLCTFFNKVWLEFTGRTMEQELGIGWTESVHPDDLDRCIGTYTASFDDRRPFRMEYRLRRADGDYRWILDDGVPRFTPDNTFAGYIGSCIDITEFKRMQEEVFTNQKTESLAQLARGVAHDFNNLLGGILANTELALAICNEGTLPEKELLTVRSTAIRGGEIVRQLMTYGGEENLAFELVDVSSLVNEMLQLLKISITKKVILETDLGESLPALHASPSQIRQIVMNLVTNASEAIGNRNGVIRVTTSLVRDAANLPLGDYLKLEVSDTGGGMTSEVQSKIFDPFFTTKMTGRGLGLAGVHRIVRNHFGVINVVSSLGQGTRFEILLPCTDKPVHPFPGIVTPVSASEERSVAATVLVVEDEYALRIPVSAMLRKQGFFVVEATEGDTAVNLFRANELGISVVLLDMTLPGMSGPEVLRELRRIRHDVKVILTTAYDEETTLADIGEQQAWAFLRKPYHLSDLVNLIWKACLQKGEISDRAASSSS